MAITMTILTRNGWIPRVFLFVLLRIQIEKFQPADLINEQYIVSFTVTISRFLSKQLPANPSFPISVLHSARASPTHSLFLVRILFINRDRSVSLFRRRRVNVGTFEESGRGSRGGYLTFVYEIQDGAAPPSAIMTRSRS